MLTRCIIVSCLLLSIVSSGEAQTSAPRLEIQLGHSDSVHSIALSPDSRYALTGGVDRVAILWEISTGRELRRFEGHNGYVDFVAISRDGRFAATDGLTGVRLWDLENGKEVQNYKFDSELTALGFDVNSQAILTAHQNGRVRSWDTRTATVEEFDSGATNVKTATFSADGRFAAISGDGGILVWDVIARRAMTSLRDSCKDAASMAFSSDNSHLAIGDIDGNVCLWNVTQAGKPTSFDSHAGAVRAIAFSPNGELIVTGHRSGQSASGVALIWNVASTQQMARLQHSSFVNAATFSADGSDLLTGSADGISHLWRWKDNQQIRQFRGYSLGAQHVFFSSAPSGSAAMLDCEPQVGGTKPDAWSSSAAIIAGDQFARVWDIRRGQEVKRFEVSSSQILSAALSRNGKFALTGSTDESAQLWDVSSGRQIQSFNSNAGVVSAVAFSHDGNFALTGHGDHLPDITVDPDLRQLDSVRNSVKALTSTRVSKFVPSPSTGTVLLWEVATGRMVKRFEGHRRPVTSVIFSPKDSRILSGSEDGSVRLWDVATGEEIRRFETKDANWRVFSVAFSPDGCRILTGDEQAARLWHVETGTEMLRLLRYDFNDVASVGFTSDGRALLTGSGNGKVRIWDPSSGHRIRLLEGHEDRVSSLAASSDGLELLTGSYDRTARLWSFDTGDETVRLISFVDDAWTVTAPDGRFNTNNLERVKELSWVMSDDYQRSFPLEVYMRDYYEPQLLPRLLACRDAEAKGDTGACRKAFKPVRSLAELNRIQPGVRILRVQRGSTADEIFVDVEVAAKQDSGQKNGKTSTSVYDLRLFRNGQIVGQWPEPRGGIGGAEDIERWRAESRVPMADGQTKAVHRFAVHLPRRDKGKPVTLATYAFNEDRVKSETASDDSYRVPDDVEPAKPRAYVITIGINAYQNPKWKLGFAVKDAQALSDSLQQIQGYDVVPVALISEDQGGLRLDQATKENIEAVLAQLAGKNGPYRDRLANVIGPLAETLQKASPDDLVLLAFSGHGYTDQQARFYLLPSDSGMDSTITDASLQRFVSSDELSQWLKDVDAGEMVMLIDACHSAASMPEDFKPGPMGDRGLGQLAYDKGMQILAATQADDVALESEKLGQGLLTYALVDDGLKARKAALDAKGHITVSNWLRYAEKRVPQLYDEIRTGKLPVVGFDANDVTRELVRRDPIIDLPFYQQVAKRAQTPALFDFYKQNYDPVLWDGN